MNVVRTAYLAAWCCGIMLVFYVPVVKWIVWLGGLFLLGIVLIVLRLKNKTMCFQAALCVLVFLLGASYAMWRTQTALAQQWPVSQKPQAVHLRITITGLPETDEAGYTQFVAHAQTDDGRIHRLLLRDFVARDWPLGSVWQVQARVRAPVAWRNVAGFDAEAWALAQGLDGTASLREPRFRLPETVNNPKTWLTHWRAHINDKWQHSQVVAPEGSALMRALTIGERAGLSPEMWAAFRPLGINHLISISGLHITLFATLMAVLIHKIMLLLPRVPQRPRSVVLLFGCVAAVIYTLLSGAEVPALRSLLMLLVLAAHWFWRGWANGWRAWWWAMAVVLLYQPFAVLTAGFWLSFGLVAALMWVLSWRIAPRQRTWRTRLHGALLGQWAATLLSGVATVFLFGLLPVFSPLVNALAIPWFSWVLVPLGLLVSFLPFDAPVVWVSHLAQWTMDVLLYWGNSLPEWSFAHAPLSVFVLAVFAALLLLLPRGTRIKPLAMIALLVFVLYQPPRVSGSLKATVLDVGQGLAIVLQTPHSNLLFDTGTPAAEAALLPVLRAMGIRHLDKVWLSHHDNDHDGGWLVLQKNLSIKQLLAGQPEFYAQAQDCRDVASWQQDGVWFEMLTLPRHHDGHDNNASCVLRVRVNGQAMLITGDLDSKSEQILLQHYGESLASDVLVLGHHGSRSSSSGAFINAIDPRFAIASSGFANPFSHPHPEVQTRLRAHDVVLWRTDTQGAITVELGDGDQVRLSHLPRRYWWHKKPFEPNAFE